MAALQGRRRPAAEAAATTTKSLANRARLVAARCRRSKHEPGTPQSAKADFPKLQPPVSTGGERRAAGGERRRPATASGDEAARRLIPCWMTEHRSGAKIPKDV
ncbi:MAG TPA: hypothetical protein VGB15_05570, partial [Longimicrobium sp.]